MTVTSAPERTRFTTDITCPRCGSSADRKYCANCGTRLNQRRDLSVKHYLREAFAAIIDVDSVFVGTFRTLLARPGRLSTEYLHGDRHRYLAPFRVFLLCNVVYFVFATQYGSTVLTAPLRTQVGEMTYRRLTRPTLEQRYHITLPPPRAPLKELNAAIPPALAQRYDAATSELGKTMLVVLIPVYAVLLTLMFAGTRRYFVEHLVFATHYMSFFLLALPGVVLAVAGYAGMLTLATGHRFVISGLMFHVFEVALVLYAYAAQREFYQSRRLPALVRGAVFGWSFKYTVVGFKLMLFFATLYWIGR